MFGCPRAKSSRGLIWSRGQVVNVPSHLRPNWLRRQVANGSGQRQPHPAAQQKEKSYWLLPGPSAGGLVWIGLRSHRFGRTTLCGAEARYGCRQPCPLTWPGSLDPARSPDYGRPSPPTWPGLTHADTDAAYLPHALTALNTAVTAAALPNLAAEHCHLSRGPPQLGISNLQRR